MQQSFIQQPIFLFGRIHPLYPPPAARGASRKNLSGVTSGDPGASGKPPPRKVFVYLVLINLPGRRPSGLAFLNHLPVISLAHLLQQLVQGHGFHDIIEGPQCIP